MDPQHADRFESLDDTLAARWANFPGGGGRVYFPHHVGLVLEEVRHDYARMRLPYRAALDQPAGVVHGGAIATLVDTVVVPAVGQAYAVGWGYFTVQLDVRFIGTVVQEDVVAEGWVEVGAKGRPIARDRRCTLGRIARQPVLSPLAE